MEGRLKWGGMAEIHTFNSACPDNVEEMLNQNKKILGQNKKIMIQNKEMFNQSKKLIKLLVEK